jgi:hypothetical protein
MRTASDVRGLLVPAGVALGPPAMPRDSAIITSG